MSGPTRVARAWLTRYRTDAPRADVVAGLTLAAYLLPADGALPSAESVDAVVTRWQLSARPEPQPAA